MITSAIGKTPEELFALAYPRKKRSGNPLVQRFLEIEGASEEPEILITQEGLDRMVEAAVRRSLQSLGSEPGEPKH